MLDYKIKDAFICDNCRSFCGGGCHEKLMAIRNGDMSHFEENKDLIGRKQIIHCLGKYCDKPCELQRDEYTPFDEKDGIQPLIDLMKWMGNKINEQINKIHTLTKIE